MAKHGNGICGVCKRKVALTARAHVWRHDPLPAQRVSKLVSCSGSWTPAIRVFPTSQQLELIYADPEPDGVEQPGLFPVAA